MRRHRETALERAIAALDREIEILQHARAKLVDQRQAQLVTRSAPSATAGRDGAAPKGRARISAIGEHRWP